MTDALGDSWPHPYPRFDYAIIEERGVKTLGGKKHVAQVHFLYDHKLKRDRKQEAMISERWGHTSVEAQQKLQKAIEAWITTQL